ncbi:ATP-dependent zinc metalloprotease FtsH [Nitrospira sp. T9]|jgi:cell division protease FtsH|uniref:ATP-dependent zinc metalloprotease FtsH n=2 Tax=Nitrospira TaxID=1234 RepID=A0AA96GJR2_9BACT|nr:MULTISPECIES: ATP-dependent zinc metalloprotease FtsH [Nitrospira]WNM59674.1 ATP-dependent zinc metalloprotease FtsH [Candidatus Nitrospira allomarina]WNM61837.1 ATP-dependent zinc metalloprotease FtsH [Candidatus Nitrospira neomarina]
MNSRVKNLLFWVFVCLFMILLFNLFTVPNQHPEDPVIFSDFMAHLEKGDVERVIIKNNNISAILKDGTRIQTYSVEYPDLVKVLQEKSVQIEAKPPEDNPWYITFLLSWGPFVLFLGLWFFLMRQMQMGGNRALSFGKSRARLLTEEKKKITFADVAGVDEAKEEVVEIIDFLKDPAKFQKLGGRIPKGVLIVGPPGTGKTLLAKAIAGEAGVPFFSISGSDFVEMFVGVGASRVRDLFEQGKKHAPCIIFIDEIDAVGRLRGAGLGGGHDEREQTLNQLLVEMDGFDTTEGVILIAATNRPDVLDPALLRPGRFDRQVVVNRPDVRGRGEILKVHTKKVPVSSDVDLEQIARGTPGFSGADLENLVNEAALWAARLDKKTVDQIDFENAKDKVLMGVERKSMVLTEEEKRTTAFHEAGHALMAKLLPGTDPVHKVTIIPRGRALGMTMQLPIDDRHSYSKDFLYNTLSILFGGRVAEELIFKSVTTGAGNDIERATDLARKMVCEWGMSEKLGPLTFGKKDEEVFLGRDFGSRRDFSDQVALEIDKEVKRLVVESYERTTRMLTEHIHTLRAIAEALLEKEVLDGIEIEKIVQQSSSLEQAAAV